MTFIKPLILFTIFTSSVFANDENLILTPYPNTIKESSTKYKFVDYRHMQSTDRKSSSFTKLISGQYYGSGYKIKNNGVHFSQVLKNYSNELIKSGFKIHVNCQGKSCGSTPISRFVSPSSYRYNAYNGIEIFNDSTSLGIISASKIEDDIEHAIMLTAKQDYKNNVKIAYEQISSTDLPKANIKVNDSYQVNLLDYKKLKSYINKH